VIGTNPARSQTRTSRMPCVDALAMDDDGRLVDRALRRFILCEAGDLVATGGLSMAAGARFLETGRARADRVIRHRPLPRRCAGDRLYAIERNLTDGASAPLPALGEVRIESEVLQCLTSRNARDPS